MNKQDPFIISSGAISDNLLGVTGDDLNALDGPLLQSALQSDNAPSAVVTGAAEKDIGLVAPEDISLSNTEQLDRGNFKNQVMTIKDFGAIDSKRTS